jgi:hypothetical protein
MAETHHHHHQQQERHWHHHHTTTHKFAKFLDHTASNSMHRYTLPGRRMKIKAAQTRNITVDRPNRRKPRGNLKLPGHELANDAYIWNRPQYVTGRAYHQIHGIFAARHAKY